MSATAWAAAVPYKLRGAAILGALLCFPGPFAFAQPADHAARAGDTYELTRRYETSQRSNDEGTGSSSGHTTLLERVVAVREDGVEFEYDLPPESKARDQGRTWQMPARIFRPASGEPRLTNAAELEARVEAWLGRFRLPRAACGRWYFTWNAFQVECDPQGVLATVAGYQLEPDELRDGALFREEGALAPAQIRRVEAGPDGAIFVVDLAVDPEWVRRREADTARAVAEISGPDRASTAPARLVDTVTGTISVRFETDAAGRVVRRTKVTNLQINYRGGRIQWREGTEVLTRRLMARGPAPSAPRPATPTDPVQAGE